VHVAAITQNALAGCPMHSAGPLAEIYDAVFHCAMPVIRHVSKFFTELNPTSESSETNCYSLCPVNSKQIRLHK
jgi:hypothetical protein